MCRLQGRLMKELAHRREIKMQTFRLGSNCVLVEGRLIDRGHPVRDTKHPKKRQPIHEMVIRWRVKGPEMLIEEASATMPHHPSRECPAILPVIRNLEGLRIAPGFTIKVKKAIGGIKGCAHVTSLVLAMAEETIQGHWAAYIEGRKKKGLSERDIKNLINTCHLWREEGPIVKALRKQGTPRHVR